MNETLTYLILLSWQGRRGTERSTSGELGSAKLSLYAAIPEILRSRSACIELDGLECGPLIGRGCEQSLRGEGHSTFCCPRACTQGLAVRQFDWGCRQGALRDNRVEIL